VSQLASTENHLAFVLVAVSRVINRTVASNDTLLMTILHCNIYLALKYSKSNVFCVKSTVDENISTNSLLFVQLVVTANLWRSESHCIHRCTVKCTKCFIQEFLSFISAADSV